MTHAEELKDNDSIPTLSADNPRLAAYECGGWLCNIAKDLDMDPMNVKVKGPEEDAMGRGAWRVMWEEGPYRWANAIAAGESIYAIELGQHGGLPQIDVLNLPGTLHAEPFNGFILCFYE